MIYDLKRIEAEALSQPMTMMESYKLQALLAIAERLDALVDAQKNDGGRCLVEFECAYSPDKLAIMPRKVYCVEVDLNGVTALRTLYGERVVKGTLAEVLAKLRGEVTK